MHVCWPLKVVTEKLIDAARNAHCDPDVHRQFLEMLLKKSNPNAAFRATQPNATAILYSKDVKVILEVL